MTPSELRVIDAPRGSALPASPEAWLAELGGPALLRVRGRDTTRCRVVTTLLHGNEPSGLRALHAWLREAAEPAVDALLFIGAVEAAQLPPGFACRVRPGGRDLNRVFREPFPGREGALARGLLARLRIARPEALVDVHNNTGHNPAYGVGARAGAAELNLVALFAERYVHSDLELGAIVEATADEFPSVVIECGRAGDPVADELAHAGIARFLARERLECERLEVARMQLLRTPVRVRLASGCSLVFSTAPKPEQDLTLHPDLEHHNFTHVATGTRIGWLGSARRWPLLARDTTGRDLSRVLFEERDGALVVRRPLVPIMVTTDTGIAQQDCLFYAVEPGPLLGEAAADPAPAQSAPGFDRSGR